MVRACVIVVSDGVVNKTREDKTGPILVKRCLEEGFVVEAIVYVADELNEISQALINASHNADLIITTGGTGISPRDVTPEATREVIEKEIPGFGEIVRVKSFDTTVFASLSRAIAGVYERTLIVNMPGSIAGVEDSCRILFPILTHACNQVGGVHDWHEGNEHDK